MFDPIREFTHGDAFDRTDSLLSELTGVLSQEPGYDGRLPHRLAVCVTKLDDPRVFQTAHDLGMLSEACEIDMGGEVDFARPPQRVDVGMSRDRLQGFAETLADMAVVDNQRHAIGAGAPFLTNLLPLGKTGSVVSAGVIPLLNIAVGIAVSTGFAVLFLEYLEETREPEGEDEE